MAKKYIVKFDSKDTRRTVEANVNHDFTIDGAEGVKSYKKEDKKTLIFKTKNSLKKKDLKKYLEDRIPEDGEFKIKKFKEEEKAETKEEAVKEVEEIAEAIAPWIVNNVAADDYTVLVIAHSAEEAMKIAIDYFKEAGIEYDEDTMECEALTSENRDDYSYDTDYVLYADVNANPLSVAEYFEHYDIHSGHAVEEASEQENDEEQEGEEIDGLELPWE